MSTQGVRHVALFLLVAAVCRPVVLTAGGPSLETQESTSRGRDAEPPLELSTARMWAISASPSPDKEEVISRINYLRWWFQWHIICVTLCMTRYSGNNGAGEEEIERSSHRTSPRLCIGYIDKTIYHLAHLLDLRSWAVDWAAWIVCSFKCEQLITDTLLLHSGSLPLCPAKTNSQSLIWTPGKSCDSHGDKVQSPYLLVEYRVRMLNLCWLLNM